MWSTIITTVNTGYCLLKHCFHRLGQLQQNWLTVLIHEELLQSTTESVMCSHSVKWLLFYNLIGKLYRARPIGRRGLLESPFRPSYLYILSNSVCKRSTASLLLKITVVQTSLVPAMHPVCSCMVNQWMNGERVLYGYTMKIGWRGGVWV